MKYVNFLFHIYQPPVQSMDVLAKIVQQSYEPLTRTIREFKDLRFTLNVNFSLVELLDRRYPQVIENIQAAHANGTLELTATGAYHPIFPLIPHTEVRRQLELNHSGNQRLLTPSFQPEGVFPPELAFTCGLVPLFKSMGYRWTIADDGNLEHYQRMVPYDVVYSVLDFPVFFRSNFWANAFANYNHQWNHGEQFVDDLIESINSWMGPGDGYLIIALDGETFGHHHPELDSTFTRQLCEALQRASHRLQTAHLSTLSRRFRHISQFVPPGSWSTDRVDLHRRDYVSWWRTRESKIHDYQWQFTALVLKKVRNLASSRELNEEMDRALYSCQYWWASCFKFNPGEIYRGAFNMMRILQKAERRAPDPHLLRYAEAVFRNLVTETEKYHRREV